MVTMLESCCQSQILRHTMTGKFVLDVNYRMAQISTTVEDYR